jgi:hypothetical protein
MGAKEKACGKRVSSRAACGAEPETFVSCGTPQNCRCPKGSMGKVPLTTKSSSLIGQVAKKDGV